MLITNPRVVAALEEDRFSLGDVLAVRDRSRPRYEDYSEESAAILLRAPIYKSLALALAREIKQLQSVTPDVGVGPGYEHRLFDLRWLGSPRVHFELVGVVNRIDFRSLTPPGCGQTRLVYRLAYRPAGRPQTRLPLTLNFIYENRETDCATVAERWLALEPLSGAALIGGLRSGPLAHLDPSRMDRIEVNIQSLRQNSNGIAMDDHAEYILRGFNVVNGTLVKDTLRNTPDTELPADKKDALRDWIKENFDAIERGAAELPHQFLASRSVSVAPRGLSRMANRPFKRLFPDEDNAFAGLPYSRQHIAVSPEMLVRRLDQMSCAGCHESRTIAGFHLLGEDRGGGSFNALTLGISEHLREILDWRFRFLKQAATGHIPTEPVPIAERPDPEGGFGAHCAVTTTESNEDPAWPCAKGFVCQPSPVHGDTIGQCVREGSTLVGDSCESVTLLPTPGPDGDGVLPDHEVECFSAKGVRCEPNHNGFSGGMCSAECDREGARAHGGVCMRVPHHGFEGACFKPDSIIEKCLTKRPNFDFQLMRACSRTEPCRDDYVCARLPDSELDQGGCVPPYFVFQARVDGPPIDREDSPAQGPDNRFPPRPAGLAEPTLGWREPPPGTAVPPTPENPPGNSGLRPGTLPR